MKKECRVCRQEYHFCPSCIFTRPYLQKFCSVKCKLEYEERQREKINQQVGGINEKTNTQKTN